MVNVLKWYSHLFAVLVCLTDFLIASLLMSFHLHLMASLTACRFINSSRHTSYQDSAKYYKSNNLDALTVSLFFRKFSCSLSTSPFFFVWQVIITDSSSLENTIINRKQVNCRNTLFPWFHLTATLHHHIIQWPQWCYCNLERIKRMNCSIHTWKEFILYVVYVLLQ